MFITQRHTSVMFSFPTSERRVHCSFSSFINHEAAVFDHVMKKLSLQELKSQNPELQTFKSLSVPTFQSVSDRRLS